MLERQGKAIFLKEDYKAPSIVSKTKREIGHLHESDSSGHVVLSIADANQVVAKGWGERHRLTGTVDPTGTFAIPLGYTMLYVPRNFEEVETYLKIFDAAIEYAKSNGKSP